VPVRLRSIDLPSARTRLVGVVVGVGYVLVYLGFGYGLTTLWLATTRLRSRARRRQTPTAVVAACFGVACVGAFWLPAISGLPQGTLNSWRGLDPLSTVVSVVLVVALAVHAALPSAGGDLRAVLIASMSGSLAAVVVGNAVIQTFTARDSDAEWGLYTAAGAALAATIAGVAGLHGATEE
jgi:hypothetical protein